VLLSTGGPGLLPNRTCLMCQSIQTCGSLLSSAVHGCCLALTSFCCRVLRSPVCAIPQRCIIVTILYQCA
jgi:hypothetical protein